MAKTDIRKYRTDDLEEIMELFYNTVHTVNRRDYNSRQLNAWAGAHPDPVIWDQSLREHYSLVAWRDGVITGFGDMDFTGYLDRLYVHREYQGQGIATLLCGELESWAGKKQITVHASITAKTFFERRGYQVVREQQVERSGVFLTNYVMIKGHVRCPGLSQ